MFSLKGVRYLLLLCACVGVGAVALFYALSSPDPGDKRFSNALVEIVNAKPVLGVYDGRRTAFMQINELTVKQPCKGTVGINFFYFAYCLNSFGVPYRKQVPAAGNYMNVTGPEQYEVISKCGIVCPKDVLDHYFPYRIGGVWVESDAFVTLPDKHFDKIVSTTLRVN